MSRKFTNYWYVHVRPANITLEDCFCVDHGYGTLAELRWTNTHLFVPFCIGDMFSWEFISYSYFLFGSKAYHAFPPNMPIQISVSSHVNGNRPEWESFSGYTGTWNKSPALKPESRLSRLNAGSLSEVLADFHLQFHPNGMKQNTFQERCGKIGPTWTKSPALQPESRLSRLNAGSLSWIPCLSGIISSEWHETESFSCGKKNRRRKKIPILMLLH